MIYFSNISKTFTVTPCLLVIWCLIMINLSILKSVRVKWCSHLYWLWKDIREVGHVFLKCFHRTAKLLIFSSIFFSISRLISISSLSWARICWSIGIFFHSILFLRLEIISLIFARDDFFSLTSISLVFSHSKLFSISSSFILIRFAWPITVTGSFAGLMIKITMLSFQYLVQSFETEHQLNQQHHCSYFQWLVIQTISCCTSRKTLLQLDHSHFVCQNQALF